MTFLVVFACSVAAVFVLRNPLKACPVAFYVAAVVVDVLFVFDDVLGLPGVVSDLLFLTVRKCTLPLALFTVVMFVGVFDRDTRVRRWLQPVRAEVSIVAWLLSLGHVTMYLNSYVFRLMGGQVRTTVAASIAVALVLFVLLVVLGVTSFHVVKRRMSTATWKRVQRLSYVFFGLVYVHLMLMLGPAALGGGAKARFSVVVYTVIFGSYAAGRIARAVRSRRAAR